MRRTLFRGGTVVTNDPAIGDLRTGDVLVENDRIVAVAPKLEVGDGEVIDCGGMIVAPGFVDSHRHTWQSLLRAVGTDWTLAQYFTGMRLVMGRLYTADDIAIANYLGALECLDAGITTLYDWCHNLNSPEHADAAVDALRCAGIRGVWGYGNANDENIPPSTMRTNLADVERVRKEHFAADDGLLTMAFAARGPEITTLDLTEEEFRFVRDLGLRITVHVGVGALFNRPVAQLHSRGLLAPDTTYIHCNTLDDEEMRLIINTGGTTAIGPNTELNMGMGDLPTMRFLRLGHRTSISIDVVSSAPGDMFNAMRTTLSAARADEARVKLADGGELDPMQLTTKDVYEFATIEGARCCGTLDRTASLVPGKQADIILIDARAINMLPLNYAIGTIVQSCHPGNVDSVYVAGIAKKRHGKLVGVDLDTVRRRAEAARNGLFERAGLPHDQHWVPKPMATAAINTHTHPHCGC